MQDQFLKNITFGVVLEIILALILGFAIIYFSSFLINKISNNLTGKKKYNLLIFPWFPRLFRFPRFFSRQFHRG